MSIEKKDTPETLAKKNKKLRKLKTGFPAHKFLEKIAFGGNPVEEQRKLRNEWQ